MSLLGVPEISGAVLCIILGIQTMCSGATSTAVTLDGLLRAPLGT